MAKNVPASVKAKLLALARERGEDFQFVLTRYAIERFLYRLSQSSHRDEFILKGATLFALWSNEPHRPTKDVDLLGTGDPDPGRVREVVRSVLDVDVAYDGVELDRESVEAGRIRDDEEYEGVRVTLSGRLGSARVKLQIDVGFGDAVTPDAQLADVPTLLTQPAPRLKVYPRETVVAEKFQAMVDLGIANSRMKDFYDVMVLADTAPFEGDVLGEALRRTFDRRRTVLPIAPPVAFTDEFVEDHTKKKQWAAFLRKSRLEPLALSLAVQRVASLVMPMATALAAGSPPRGSWTPGGPWTK